MSQYPTQTPSHTDLPNAAQIEHLITLLSAMLEKAQTADMREAIGSFVTMLDETMAAMDRVTGDLQRILPAAEATEQLKARMDRLENMMMQMSAQTTKLHDAMLGPADLGSPHGGSSGRH
ncbi:hypothetical protein PARPLA_01675 [Rhodobacteraceae bacterium THAF1]|nr:hypothetical protein FIU81_09030 [Palleronia sp. THAF1]VDC23950.1 hypothetical protein PARPLA_01675 [Rhodobacteraceae bacterium THAF1]